MRRFTDSVQKWEIEEGLASGAQAYLIKPDDLDRIPGIVTALIMENRRFIAAA